MNGDPDALAQMREYNKQDVDVTEKVYLKLLGYIQNHPNLNLWPDKDIAGKMIDSPCCPNCGSDNSISHGYRTSMTGRYQRRQCKNCGKAFQVGKRLFSTEVK